MSAFCFLRRLTRVQHVYVVTCSRTRNRLAERGFQVRLKPCYFTQDQKKEKRWILASIFENIKETNHTSWKLLFHSFFFYRKGLFNPFTQHNKHRHVIIELKAGSFILRLELTELEVHLQRSIYTTLATFRSDGVRDLRSAFQALFINVPPTPVVSVSPPYHWSATGRSEDSLNITELKLESSLRCPSPMRSQLFELNANV